MSDNFTGGLDAVVGYGQRSAVRFANYDDNGAGWVIGDSFFIGYSTTNGPVNLGHGWLKGIAPTAALAFDDRIYVPNGQQFNFCAIGDATGWETQSAGASYIIPTSTQGQQSAVVGFGQYQGCLAVYTRTFTQIWATSGDPSQFVKKQSLDNCGCIASQTIKSIGDYDVLALGDTGVWSLRVRDSSSNAIRSDVGSPINPAIRTMLSAYADPTTIAACSIVEPSTNQYWIFVPDATDPVTPDPAVATKSKLFVLSYFPNIAITAWSTFDCVDSGAKKFTPSKFVVCNGQVYCRGTSEDGKEYLYQYTGYDATLATAELPWLSGKEPARVKIAKSLYVVGSGNWTIKASMDFREANIPWNSVGTFSKPSFDIGRLPWASKGTHFKVQASTTDASAAVLSSLVIRYELDKEI